MDEKQAEVEIYTLEDEEGNSHEFQLIATTEIKGTKYFAMLPLEDAKAEDDTFEYVILKAIIEDGEETLISIDDDDEFDDVADYFDDLLADEIDYDAKA